MKFSLWLEKRNQKSAIGCPHPENKEFCREYNQFINGKRKTAPKIEDYESKKVATGHNPGPRASTYADKKDKMYARKGRAGNPYSRGF